MLPLAAAAILSLQSAPAGDSDAVIAAPDNHQIVLENDRVRVLRVVVEPGATEPVHIHRWPGVMHFQCDQPLVAVQYEERDGELVEAVRFDIPPGSFPEDPFWVEPEGPHAIHNAGTEKCEGIRVELKP